MKKIIDEVKAADREYIGVVVSWPNNEKTKKPITLISVQKDSSGIECFVFEKKFTYGIKDKIITFHTHIDLRASRRLWFWLEKSKIPENTWTIKEEWNLLTFSGRQPIDMNRQQQPKQIQSEFSPPQIIDPLKKDIGYSKALVENEKLKNELQEIKEKLWTEEKENIEKIFNLKMDAMRQQMNWMQKDIKAKARQFKSTQNENIETTHIRIRALIKQVSFKTFDSFKEGDVIINSYEFQHGPQGSKWGAKKVLYKTPNILQVGDVICFFIPQSQSHEVEWEIKDEENKVFINKSKK